MAQGGPLGPQGSHRPGSRLVDAHLGAGARGRNTVSLLCILGIPAAVEVLFMAAIITRLTWTGGRNWKV